MGVRIGILAFANFGQVLAFGGRARPKAEHRRPKADLLKVDALGALSMGAGLLRFKAKSLGKAETRKNDTLGP